MSLVLLPIHTFKWPKFTAASIWLHKEPIKADLSFNATPMMVTNERKPHTRIANNGNPPATRIKSMGVDVVSNILYKYYIVDIRSMSACEFTIMDLWEWEENTILCVLTQVRLKPGVEGQSLLVTTEPCTVGKIRCSSFRYLLIGITTRHNNSSGCCDLTHARDVWDEFGHHMDICCASWGGRGCWALVKLFM